MSKKEENTTSTPNDGGASTEAPQLTPEELQALPFREYCAHAGVMPLLNQSMELFSSSATNSSSQPTWIDGPIDEMLSVLHLKRECVISSVKGFLRYDPLGRPTVAVRVQSANGRCEATSSWLRISKKEVPQEETAAGDGDASGKEDKPLPTGKKAEKVAAAAAANNADEKAAAADAAQLPIRSIHQWIAPAIMYKDCRDQEAIDAVLSTLSVPLPEAKEGGNKADDADNKSIHPSFFPGLTMLVSSTVMKLHAKIVSKQPYELVQEMVSTTGQQQEHNGSSNVMSLPVPWFTLDATMDKFIVPTVGRRSVPSWSDAIRKWCVADKLLRSSLNISSLCDDTAACYPAYALIESEHPITTHDVLVAATKACSSAGMSVTCGVRSEAAWKDISEVPVNATYLLDHNPKLGAVAKGGASIADNALYSSSGKEQEKSNDRNNALKKVSDGGKGGWAMLRLDEFCTVTEVLQFTKKANDAKVRLVAAVPSAGTSADEADQPLYPHMAIGVGVSSVLLPAPHGGHATSLLNECMRIEEHIVMDRRCRWTFCGYKPHQLLQ